MWNLTALLLACATSEPPPPTPTPPVVPPKPVVSDVEVHEVGLIDVKDGKAVRTISFTTVRLRSDAPETVKLVPREGGEAVELALSATGCTVPPERAALGDPGDAEPGGPGEVLDWTRAAAVCLGEHRNVIRWESTTPFEVAPLLTLAATDDGGTRMTNPTKDVMLGQSYRIHRDDARDKVRVEGMFVHPGMPVTMHPKYPLSELYVGPSNALVANRPWDEIDAAAFDEGLHGFLFGGHKDHVAPTENVISWVKDDRLGGVPAPVLDPPAASTKRAFLLRVAAP